jgi:hypothetical protein
MMRKARERMSRRNMASDLERFRKLGASLFGGRARNADR